MERRTKNCIRPILLLASLAMFSPPAGAADGSGAAQVVPTAILTDSTDNTLTFTYTATEDLGDGSVSMTVPAGFPNPQGSNAAGAGYTTVTITDGVSATVIDDLDAVPTGTPGWNFSDGVPLLDLANMKLDTSEYAQGTGSLELNLLVGTGLSPTVWYNYASAQPWSGYTHIGFRVKYSTLLTAIADLFNNTEFKICSDVNLGGTCETHQLSTALVDITLISDGEWAQVVVTLDTDPADRTSVRSYGFDFPTITVAALSSINFDYILAGPGDPIFSGDTVTQPLLFLNAGGTVEFAYHHVDGPSDEGEFTFPIASAEDVLGSPEEIAESPVVSVIDLGTHANICEDVDADSQDECSVDTDDPADGCGDVYLDPDGSSCAVLTVDANAATDGNAQDCVDYFIDTDCDANSDGCPDIFWDATNGIISPVTLREVDTDGDGDLEAVCAFDSDGNGEDDSFELAGTGDDTGGDGGSDSGDGAGDGTEIGGAGAGGPNPFSVQGGGCSLIR